MSLGEKMQGKLAQIGVVVIPGGAGQAQCQAFSQCRCQDGLSLRLLRCGEPIGRSWPRSRLFQRKDGFPLEAAQFPDAATADRSAKPYNPSA
jgi:hypothetical protein